jgi:hypothetical protein
MTYSQKQKRSRKNQRGGMSDYPAAFQTRAELAQFGPLPGNTWAAGLGRNPGINDQMAADTGGYFVARGGNKRIRKSRKQRRN